MKHSFLKKIFKINQKSAFSLIELSVVILIVSILVAGGLTLSVNKMNKIKAESAQKRIDTIYKALGFYLTTNGKLPCPAPITAIKTSDSTYGQSAGSDGSCSASGIYNPAGTNRVYGMLPVKDLGLGSEMAEDGFGSKFAYVVDKRFTLSGSSGFGANSNNSDLMTIKEITSAGADQVNSTEAVFLIISYGANKSGAFNADSSTQNARSSDADEMSNDLDSAATPAFDATFVRSSKRSDIFDDIIFYKTRNALITDFNALSLIFCDAGNASNGDSTNYPNVVYGAYTMTWPVSAYGKIVAATGPTTNVGDGKCPIGFTASVDRPTKKCGSYGLWEVGVVSACSENGSGLGGGSNGGSGNLSCTGGTATTSGSNTIRTFIYSGSLACTGSGNLTYLVVGGGGGGGGASGDGGGGGGGGGGVLNGIYSASAQTFAVTVGSGGFGSAGNNGTAGATSSLIGGTLSASATGGSGGHVGGNNDGAGGASGAGNSSSKAGGAAGTCTNGGHGGGGGGSSMEAVGITGSTVANNHSAGAGANGTSNSITGSAVIYGSGGGGCGGGGGSEGPKASGGSGSGGAGGGGNSDGPSGGQRYAPVAGTANRGGGGGGGGIGKSGYSSAGGANGGSGVVIVSYKTL